MKKTYKATHKGHKEAKIWPGVFRLLGQGPRTIIKLGECAVCAGQVKMQVKGEDTATVIYFLLG